MKTFFNDLARFHRVDGLIADFTDALATLKAERDELQHDILLSVTQNIDGVCADGSARLVSTTKTATTGLCGKYLFSANTGYALARPSGRPLDDQDWLEREWRTAGPLEPFIRQRYALDKAALRAKPEEELKRLGLRLAPTLTLRLRTAGDLRRLEEIAAELAEEAQE